MPQLWNICRTFNTCRWMWWRGRKNQRWFYTCWSWAWAFQWSGTPFYNTEPRNLTTLTISRTYTQICFTSHNPLKHIFIPIIVILNNLLIPWTSIPAKGLHFKLHLVDATFNASTKSTNSSSIGHSICISPSIFSPSKTNFNPPFKMIKSRSYTSWYGQKKKKPPKSKSSKPFATTSTILNTMFQSHHTNQVRARKKDQKI
jgi:hypothetical protein